MTLTSTAPLKSGTAVSSLAEPFEPKSAPKGDKKSKMRGLFSIGHKKTDESAKTLSRSDPASNNSRRSTTSPIRTNRTVPALPSSPSRGLSSSPGLSSPAGSQIFERDVQESVIPNSPAIPSHIKTEDFVPPVLDASSEAITDSHLDPDSVEIITHAHHQPAALNLTGLSDHTSNASWQDDLAASLTAADLRPLSELTESGSNYGSLDSADVRRLSFISFADVVQAEHQGHAGIGGSRESIHLAGLTSLSPMGNIDHHYASPIRSPVSSTAGDPATSSPNSKPVSLRGNETSPSRKPIGSPVSVSLSMSPIPLMGIPGEIAVETMAQALKRTESGDLNGGIKSHPTSPIDMPSR